MAKRRKEIKEELVKLTTTEFIRKIQHPEWLANAVLVPKPNGTLYICIDFTDLNKAYPKDSFSLQRIDQIVYSMLRCERLCLLDAYSGYDQIRMYPGDEEKTSFIIPFGIYFYKIMLFGLKNVGVTYQHAM